MGENRGEGTVSCEGQTDDGRAGVCGGGDDVESVQVTAAAFATAPAVGEVRLTRQAVRVDREAEMVVCPVQ